MSDINNLPTVIAAPGIVASDGHEHFWSPRNIIAFIIVALFGAYLLLPYWFSIPTGRNGDQIVTGGKVLETILVLIVGFFFGTTVGSNRKDATIERQAAAATAVSLAQPGNTDTFIRVDPPADVAIREAPNAPDPAARPAQPASPAPPPRVSPRDDGPAE